MARPPGSKKERRGRLFGRRSSRYGTFAMIQPNKAIAKVSAATIRTVGEAAERTRQQHRVRSRQKQRRSYEYFDLVSELGFLMTLKANLVARCDLVLQEQEQQEDGTYDWKNSTDPKGKRVMEAFVGPQGGQAELKRKAALHLSVGGEALLLGTAAGDDGSIVWEFLSVLELLIESSGETYRIRDEFDRERVDRNSYTARCWRSHPAYSENPDSEVLRTLPLCGQIVSLDQAIGAIIDGKLAAQVLFVPEEMTFSGDSDDEDDADDEGGSDIDSFTQDLVDHLSEPKLDPTSPASLIPLIMRGPAELGDKIKMIEVARDLDDVYQTLRGEALQRLFRGLDAPPEMISGKGGLAGLGGGNVAISIDLDFVNKHVLPLGELIADFVTVAYLRPMLEEFEDVDADSAARFRVTFDPAIITARAEQAPAAEKLHADELLSNDAFLLALGFDPADKPDDDELFQRRIWDLISSAPAVFAKGLLPLVKGFESVDMSQIGAPAVQKQLDTPVPPGAGEAPGLDGQGALPAPSANPALGPAPTVPPPRALGPTAEQQSMRELALRLLTAADYSVERALEVAGSRVISKIGGPNTRDTTMADRVRSTSKLRVLEALGPADLKALRLPPEKLFTEAWQTLAIRANGWIREHLIASGMSAPEADERASFAAMSLCETVDALVLARMHTGLRRGANGYRVPDEVVLTALNDIIPATARSHS